MEEMLQNLDQPIPIIILTEYSTQSFVMGYHDYKNYWKPEIGQQLETEMQPKNPMDMFAVCVCREGKVVGHLMKGVTGRYAKTIFYFLQADRNHQCHVEIIGRAVNKGDGKGMKVPCKLHIVGRQNFIKLLEKELTKNL